jgi:hypothetical protein
VIADYLALADRIRQESVELARGVNRAERAVRAARERPEDQDLYVDAAALNPHDFYAGLERIFEQIGSTVDGQIPRGRDWHRRLLQQMQSNVDNLRPAVLSHEAGKLLDEYLRFRHVVRSIYAFHFDPERIERLVGQMRPVFEQVRVELLTFVSFLERIGGDE